MKTTQSNQAQGGVSAQAKTSNPIQIFKAGKHTAMSGDALSFSESDLVATAKAYDPAKHEAPIVCGHPKHDDPAYGWIGKLAFTDGTLEAEPIQVDAAFAEMVGRGAFKKISASFYSPDSPSNPAPGVYYLRHVGFLGAQPPAVKGMRNPSFADAEEGVVEFSEWDDVDNASLWRSLREWFIGKFGKDEADSIIPAYKVQSLEQSALDEQREAQSEVSALTPAYAEPQSQGDDMSVEEKSRLAALEVENAALKAERATFAESEKRRAADARHAGHTAFAEELIKGGRLLPAHKDVTVATLDFMAGQEQAISFGEGDAKKPLLDGLKELLQTSAKQVEFGEFGADKGGPAGSVDFAAPRGHTVNADSMELLVRARAYMQANNVDFETAAKAVEG